VNATAVIPAALAGLVAGWEGRAVVVAYSTAGPERPRRDCPACGQRIVPGRWRSWPLPSPSGRCGSCGERIGPPPAAVEVVTAVVLGILAVRIHPVLVLAAACWLGACAVPLAFTDAAVRRLPDVLTVPAFAGTAMLLAGACAAGEGRWWMLARAVLASAALAGFFLVQVLIPRSGMGLGDVKLAAGLGVQLGWLGWGVVVAGGFAGLLLAGIWGVILLARGHSRTDRLALGPFLAAGAIAVVALAG
jgi:leader peptidase (prepilin peptidase) / N-methyltransferase